MPSPTSDAGTEYTLVWDGTHATFPPTGRGTEFWLSDDSTCDQYVETLAGNGRTRRVQVALIPRPDNTYSKRAVSVAVPPDYLTTLTGRARVRAEADPLDARHIGYLFEEYLDKLDVEAFQLAARHSGSELFCTLTVTYSRYGLERATLDLPAVRKVNAALRAFNAAPKRANLTPPGLHAGTRHASIEAHYASLAALIEWQPEQAEVTGTFALRTMMRGSHFPRALAVTLDGSTVGEVAGEVLTLRNESLRRPVSEFLTERGIPHFQPAGTASGDQVPNLNGRWRPGTVTVTCERDSTDERDRVYMDVAHYQPTIQQYTIRHPAFEKAARAYLLRLGLPATTLVVDRPASYDKPSINWDRLIDWDLRNNPDLEPSPGYDLEMRESLKQLLPPEALKEATVGWVRNPNKYEAWKGKPHPTFEALEPFVQERTTLFPDAQPTGRYVPCRLCAIQTTEFTTRLATTALAYCHWCLAGASDGRSRARFGRKSAAAALRELTVSEFDGVVPLESQLDSLHINPDEPRTGTQVDRALLLRMAIARGQHPWTHLIVNAGLAENGLRLARGTLVKARDGHMCLSLQERAVDDFLHVHKINHSREPHYPTDEDLNPKGRLRADWDLGGNVLVEMWGLPDQPAYAEKMKLKQELARRHGIILIELTVKDLPNLLTIFASRISDDNRVAWAWSPALISTADPVPEPKKRTGKVGFNEYAVEARKQRLETAETALQLQEQGLSRAAIATQLEVAKDSVGGLLRDARFYRDPSTDQQRSGLAKQAAEAVEARLTKAEFRELLELSAAKAHESWRDADVLHAAHDQVAVAE